VRAHDWRQASSGTIAPLLTAEIDRWRRDLAWETASLWARVEQARRVGGVPGLIITGDDGSVRGWSFHLLHEDTLQVGALVTDSPETTAQWVEALAASPEAQVASRWLCFGWFRAPAAAECLAEAGLAVRRYQYLRRDESASLPSSRDGIPFRPWRAGDRSHAAPLLAAAYPGADSARPFAPDGSAASWDAYSGSLIEGDANGIFAPELSSVLEGGDGQLDAMALVTRLAPAAAHVAQIVVRPGLHGQGVGRALLATVLATAQAAGCRTTTLLVHEHNARARALYESAGFTDVTVFLSATGRLRT
jgi:ribosomal protein S18 acetylase RimI-like enzyme